MIFIYSNTSPKRLFSGDGIGVVSAHKGATLLSLALGLHYRSSIGVKVRANSSHF